MINPHCDLKLACFNVKIDNYEQQNSIEVFDLVFCDDSVVWCPGTML